MHSHYSKLSGHRQVDGRQEIVILLVGIQTLMKQFIEFTLNHHTTEIIK
jgi:hypothetical protein